MDILPVLLPLVIAIVIAIDLERKQKRIKEMIARFNSLSKTGISSRRLRRYRLLFDERTVKELDREITALEQTLGIYTPYRLRRFTFLSDKHLNNLQQRIVHLEKLGSAQNG